MTDPNPPALAAAPANPPVKARYIMIGGFLGAGKTTLMSRLAQELHRRGYKIGLITNDQGTSLADTALLRSKGFATEEIPGGCFCCRFQSLLDAAQRLTTTTRPDVFLAEPVGSCTDLVATVTYPLRRIYGRDFSVAPLTVLVDPIRARRILGLDPGPRFSPKVIYIYLKQLEEADLIVLNKADACPTSALSQLRDTLAQRFPKPQILQLSARTGEGFLPWVDRIFAADQPAGQAMAVDYTTYADGEALLGWLNATLHLSHPAGFSADALLRYLATQIQNLLPSSEIAHLKMTLSPDQSLGDIASINLVRNDFVPELSQSIEFPVASGELILNIRAEADPAELDAALQSALASMPVSFPGLRHSLLHLEHFRPGKPVPTHRFSSPL